jgi:hypothetical protein
MIFLLRATPGEAVSSRAESDKGALATAVRWSHRGGEETMPVILLWGIPTLIVLAGGTYLLIHH